MNFLSLGISFRTAAESIRDKVVFTDRNRPRFVASALAAGVDQMMILSTCNRTEIFFCADDETALARLFTETFPAARTALTGHAGREALVHLARIAAGLESMVFGEYQILGQIKTAYAEARADGLVGRELDRILRDAITAAKRVRTGLDLGAVPPSVCRSGFAAAERLAGGFAGKDVFIIGSGKTGSLAARLAREAGAGTIAVCNRSPERVRRLVEAFGVETVDYAARYERIANCDIVISATASPHVVVRADEVVLSRPVVFLDLASPRDVDPRIASDPRATLVSIDTIGELAAGDRTERERLTAQGMKIIDAVVDETLAWLKAGKEHGV